MTATSALLDRWRAAAAGAGAGADPEAVGAAGAELLARWSEPHRTYHDVRHLTEVLDGVDLLAEHAEDADVVRLAAWFHDAVHDGQPGDDEEASAVLAEQVLAGLGMPDARTAEVARLVRMTAGHRPADGDADGAVLSDADLAVLAAVAARYAEYAAAVRAEYVHVPDALFRSGRAAILEGFLDQPHVYRTPTARDRWEAAARTNLTREITDLGQTPDP